METPQKNPVGHPPHRPDKNQRQMVQVLRANGIALRTIARNIEIDVNTLRKHYKEELDDGHAQVVAAMGATLVKEGLKGNVAALRYWLATHGGPQWRVTEGREISGRIEIEDASTEDLQRELTTLRDRAAIADRAGIVEATLQDESGSILH